MFKTLLLASAVLTATPALAQLAPPQDRTTPLPAAPAKQGPVLDDNTPLPPTSQDATAPVPDQTAPTSVPAQTFPGQTPSPAPADTTVGSANASAPAPGQPATTSSQVAQVVQSEFPGYDTDKNGSLSKAEFGNWMTALRKAADASYDPTTPAATTWVGQAFAAADTDKNGSLSQDELTAYLSQGKQ